MTLATPGYPNGGEYLFTVITDPEEVLFWSCLQGDALGDHSVTEADFERVVINYGRTGEDLTPFDGDLNGDGIVDEADMDIVLDNMGTYVLGVDWSQQTPSGGPVLLDGNGEWPPLVYEDPSQIGLPVGGAGELPPECCGPEECVCCMCCSGSCACPITCGPDLYRLAILVDQEGGTDGDKEDDCIDPCDAGCDERTCNAECCEPPHCDQEEEQYGKCHDECPLRFCHAECCEDNPNCDQEEEEYGECHEQCPDRFCHAHCCQPPDCDQEEEQYGEDHPECALDSEEEGEEGDDPPGGDGSNGSGGLPGGDPPGGGGGTPKIRVERVKFVTKQNSSDEVGHEVRKDSNGFGYTSPNDPWHWLSKQVIACQENPDNCCGSKWEPECEGHSERRFPIAYTQGTQVKLEVQFAIEESGAPGPYTIRGLVGGQMFFQTTSDYIGAEEIVSLAPLPAQIAYHPDWAINWQVLDKDNKQIACSNCTSTNTLYVTLNDPIGQHARYHTVLDISCRNAQGMGASHTEKQIVNAIYSEFITRNVTRASDGVLLKYWNPHNSSDVTHSVVTLLAKPNGNGACTAWAHLFYTVLRAQGITGAKLVMLRPQWHVDAGDENVDLLVKNWRFCDQPGAHPDLACPGGGTAPPNCHPFVYKYDEPNQEYEAWPHHFEPGGQMMQAQGNPNPTVAQFKNHVIVRHGGLDDSTWYDPSYGSPVVTSLLTYEIMAFDGFSIKCDGETAFKKNDPTQQEVIITSEWTPP